MDCVLNDKKDVVKRKLLKYFSFEVLSDTKAIWRSYILVKEGS